MKSSSWQVCIKVERNDAETRVAPSGARKTQKIFQAKNYCEIPLLYGREDVVCCARPTWFNSKFHLLSPTYYSLLPSSDTDRWPQHYAHRHTHKKKFGGFAASSSNICTRHSHFATAGKIFQFPSCLSFLSTTKWWFLSFTWYMHRCALKNFQVYMHPYFKEE